MHSHHLRTQNSSLDLQQGHRAFGKDITNISKGQYPLNLTKKIIPQYHQSGKAALEAPKLQRKDPIFEYHDEIIRFMQSFTKKTEVMQEESTDVNDKMRQILVDWIVDVHQSFELKQETLFLALIYLDQYQSRNPIKKDQYQLVGIACLWIASKYEQIYPPRMKNYVEVTASTYTQIQLKQMEGRIIQFLNFDLTKITPLALLQLVQMKNETHEKNLSMSKYILHLSYLNGRIIKKYEIKTLIFAAVKLSDAICKKQTKLSVLQQPTIQQIYSCYKQMCLLLQLQNKYKLTAVKRKFQKQKFHCVGKIRLQV